MIICVTGMHRSGSSCVAGMLRLAGLHLGEEATFAQPDEHNPHNYWEDLRFVRLNDRLLDHGGGAWDVPPAWPADWTAAPSLVPLREEGAALLASATALSVWGWKDPRTCLTAAFWQALQPDLRFVVCLREPGEVSRSLRWRGFTSERFGLTLWERYYGALLAVTTPAQRIVTHYDDYFENAERELRRVLDFIGIAAPPSRIAAAVTALVRDARRSRVSDGTADEGVLTPAGQAIHALLLDECRAPAMRAGSAPGSAAHRAADAASAAQDVEPIACDARPPEQPDLPYPPEEMRQLAGGRGISFYDNPSGAPLFAALPLEAYDAVLDFGCGCGRVARQLIQQRPRPRTYFGIDLHRGMIEWCVRNLAPRAPGFRFAHHDAYNPGLNPGGVRDPLPIPADDRSFSLVLAWSVFTHLVEDRARHYLAEVARVLRPDGYLHASWFLFDKREVPMMQEFQNALYINLDDPTNAVIYDRSWVLATAASVGLKVVAATPPTIRGFHWTLVMAHADHQAPAVALPEDRAPLGLARPPLMPPNAEHIGYGD
jgi:SAM-dependent methyltransferase